MENITGVIVNLEEDNESYRNELSLKCNFPGNISFNTTMKELEEKYNTGIFNIAMKKTKKQIFDEIQNKENTFTTYEYTGNNYIMQIYFEDEKIRTMSYFYKYISLKRYLEGGINETK